MKYPGKFLMSYNCLKVQEQIALVKFPGFSPEKVVSIQVPMAKPAMHASGAKGI
jgi:hypothetical protein